MGQFERVVAKRVSAGSDFLSLSPGVNPARIVVSPVGVDLELDDLPAGQRRVAARRVSQHQLVCSVTVLMEVVDALFFHQPAGEVVVRLPVLNAVVALLVFALKLEGHVQGREHLLEDLRDSLVLKDAAASSPTKEPELWNYVEIVAGKDVVAGRLAHAVADAVDEPALACAIGPSGL